MEKLYRFAGFFLFFIVFFGLSFYVSAGDLMGVEADVINSGDQEEQNSSAGVISIQVPDSLDFGAVDERGTSEE